MSTSDFIELENSNILSFNIYPFGSVQVIDLIVSASSLISDLDNPELYVILSDSSGDLFWNYFLNINFASGDINFSQNITNDDDNDGLLERGETALLNLTGNNSGSIILENSIAEINYSGSSLSFSTGEFNFGNININQSAVSNSIQVEVDDNAINGSMVSIPISFSSTNGYETNDVIQLQIGELNVNDPMGPDEYGYYIYDMNDIEYEMVPDYNWIEIDPDYGGEGDEIGINDNGDNLDDVDTINLPFPFTFYGVEYYEVSICSNGWISFGETEMRSFRNYTVPGPGGPSPIVAVFWDDLEDGEIFAYNDSQNGRFIIQWDVDTYYANSNEVFQIILYNTGSQTPTGDDEMLLQYRDFNNTSVGNYPVGNYNGSVVHGQYASVGIEDHTGLIGLEYTFNNEYPTAAMPLSDHTALFITTRSSALYAQPSLNISNDSIEIFMDQDEDISESITITNDGEPDSYLNYNLQISSVSNPQSPVDS